MSQFAIGKYEREALERERTALHYKRRMSAWGLSQIEGARLDVLEEKLGPLSDACTGALNVSAAMDFKETAEQAAAIFDANLQALAEQYLADFDYPTDEAKAAAVKSLAKAIDKTANAWIEANCAF